jgi:hypothetical protein
VAGNLGCQPILAKFDALNIASFTPKGIELLLGYTLQIVLSLEKIVLFLEHFTPKGIELLLGYTLRAQQQRARLRQGWGCRGDLVRQLAVVDHRCQLPPPKRAVIRTRPSLEQIVLFLALEQIVPSLEQSGLFLE